MPAQRRSPQRPQKAWVLDPGSGGRPVPLDVQRRTEERIRRHAAEHLAGRYTRLDIRFRSQFCYVDAYTEPEPLRPGWPPPGSGETPEEFQERMRNTPTHLCRLRYFGNEEEWGFAFYAYSSEKYELSILPSGSFYGTPEEGFECAAGVYLQG